MTQPIDPVTYVELASGIGSSLLREAREVGDGSITWDRGYDVAFGPVADAGIFNGRIGEALFFAALCSATARPEYEQASLRALTPLRAAIEQEDRAPELARALGLGLTGLGSIIYAFVRIAGFLGRPELLATAARAAEAVTPDSVSADTKYEVFWGASGAMLGLMALADAVDPSQLDRATLCVDHLLAHRAVDPTSGFRAWKTWATVPETGFAHGSSGIAHALLELHRRVPDRRLYDAAMEAFAFERSVYSPQVEDWPDHREQDLKTIISGWCHGAPGVGLSRLAALDVMDSADESDLAGDLRKALTRTSAHSVRGLDNLCCGMFGRVDFLLEVAQRLGNPSLAIAANRMAMQCVRRAASHGFIVPSPPDDEPQLRAGLWQGHAGIGYALLRLAHPERFPCILLLA